MDTCERPWGSWRVLLTDPEFTVKLITVEPGQMLSLQSHEQRSERWQVATGKAIAYVEAPPNTVMLQPTVALLQSGDTYHIPRGITHRLINPTAEPVVIVETITGTYDEDDIVRYHDSYGRA